MSLKEIEDEMWRIPTPLDSKVEALISRVKELEKKLTCSVHGEIGVFACDKCFVNIQAALKDIADGSKCSACSCSCHGYAQETLEEK